MGPSERVIITNRELIPGALWLESTYRDTDGTLFGWFHNEVGAGCANTFLAASGIRQMVSYDNGVSWEDYGVILEAAADSLQCDSENFFFAGGEENFSVIFDPALKEYIALSPAIQQGSQPFVSVEH